MDRAAGLLAGLLAVAAAPVPHGDLLEAAELGSPEFRPSISRPIGWRGDGSGRYPAADPPVHWDRRVETLIRQFRCQASRPADPGQAGGTELPLFVEGNARGHYSICDWLVLGPVSPPADAGEANKMLERETLPDEAGMDPAEGDRAGSLIWRRAAGARVDLRKLYGPPTGPRVVYLLSRIHVPDDCRAGIRTSGSHRTFAFRVWINGRRASSWDGASSAFVKGWNRVLFKIVTPDRVGNDADPWEFRAHLFPFEAKRRYTTRGIVWTTRMPDWCYGMPILLGDDLFTLSEPADLVCVDKSTGRIKWIRSQPLWSVVEPEDKKKLPNREELDAKLARLEQLTSAYVDDPNDKLQDQRRALHEELAKAARKLGPKYRAEIGWGGGNCAATPVTDGRHVYVWHGETGALACYDPKGGRRWMRFEHPGAGAEHGVNSSPVLVGDRIVVIGAHSLLAFDRDTGRTVWREEYRHPSYPTVAAMKQAGRDVVVCGNGRVVAVADGSTLHGPIGRHDGECASPITDGDRFFLVSRAGFCAARLLPRAGPKGLVEVLHQMDPKALGESETYCVGSPLYHEGLVYYVRSGWGAGEHQPSLHVIDPDAGKVVYSRNLDFQPGIFYHPKGAGVASSLVLAGRHLYVTDNRGATIVFEPGRQFRLVAKNQIEHFYTRENTQEVMNSTPIFEGNRMYYRGYQNLYCVEKGR